MKRSIKSKIIAYLDGNLEEKELEELFVWITKSEENKTYYQQIKDIWVASIGNVNEIVDTENEWQRFLFNISKTEKRLNFKKGRIFNYWQAVAAVLILGLIVSNILLLNNNNKDLFYVSASSPNGSISEICLPDSTLVYINAGSEVKFNANEFQSNRELFLEGEAYFQVTKNEKSPFVVHTEFIDVNVLGTEFNVKAYTTDTFAEITLEEGSVLVTSISEKVKLAEDNIILKPNDQLVFDKKDRRIVLKEVDTKLFTSWKENKLIFLNMNLSDLITLMERKYGVEIEVVNSEILTYHYTGTIKDETVLEMLNIIKHTLPIKYIIDGQKIKITKD